MELYQAFIIFLLFMSTVNAHILFIGHRTGKSHHISFIPIIKAAVEHKHDVTYISYFPFEHPHVITYLLQQPVIGLGNPDIIKKFALNAYEEGIIPQMMHTVDFAKSDCESLLNNEFIKEMLDNGIQYDLAVVDALFGECAVIIGSILSRHVVYYYTSGWCLPWMNHALPTPYSYVPIAVDRLTSKMTFSQRLHNTFNHLSVQYIQKYHIGAIQQEVLYKYHIRSPSIGEAEKLVDFSLINGDPVTTSPRPSLPNIAYIGGLHCRPAKSLPKELDDFIEDSGNYGFILFSLGSIVGSEMMSKEFLETLVNTFSRLKQKIIWKFKGNLDKLPDNVKLVEWMPQQDLLGNPKIRLFVTHSGLLSLQEAIFHGVPVIGIPFFGDQQGNVARIKDLGIGEIADFSNITNDTLYLIINKILNDKSYYENMRKYSAIFRDQPQKTVDTAIYWIEYVMRHGGAHHFRSAAEELNFFQYFLLDIVAFVGFVLICTLWIVVYSLRFLLRIIFIHKQPKEKNN